MGILFESLDFLYVPAPDIDAAIGYYTGVLGSKLLWKIHAFGEWEIMSDRLPEIGQAISRIV
jgi:hypothetical protein